MASRNNMDYKNGKIYAVRNSIDDDIWVRPGNLNKKCLTNSVHVLMRSVYVPHTFPLHFERIYYKMIRSYTSCATLSQLY